MNRFEIDGYGLLSGMGIGALSYGTSIVTTYPRTLSSWALYNSAITGKGGVKGPVPSAFTTGG